MNSSMLRRVVVRALEKVNEKKEQNYWDRYIARTEKYEKDLTELFVGFFKQ